jgi:hypothetical protein
MRNEGALEVCSNSKPWNRIFASPECCNPTIVTRGRLALRGVSRRSITN